jgi:hypothetical protein
MKQKKQLVILVVLVVIAGIVWYFQRVRPTLTDGTIALNQNQQLLSVENPRLHHDRLERARKSEYKSSGRNIFSPVAPPPAKVVAQTAPRRHEWPTVQPPPPTPPPPPPTLPAKFFGYGTVPNGSGRRAFLTNGDEVFIVAEGEVLLNRFRILRVGNASLEFEEISTGRRGTAPLEDQNAGGPAA